MYGRKTLLQFQIFTGTTKRLAMAQIDSFQIPLLNSDCFKDIRKSCDFIFMLTVQHNIRSKSLITKSYFNSGSINICLVYFYVLKNNG